MCIRDRAYLAEAGTFHFRLKGVAECPIGDKNIRGLKSGEIKGFAGGCAGKTDVGKGWFYAGKNGVRLDVYKRQLM